MRGRFVTRSLAHSLRTSVSSIHGKTPYMATKIYMRASSKKIPPCVCEAEILHVQPEVQDFVVKH